MRPLLLLALLAALLAGCATNDPAGDDATPDGGGNETADGTMPAEPEALTVTVGEPGAGVPPSLYHLTPATLDLVVGKTYNLTLVNDGRVAHDLVIEGLDVAIPSTAGGASSEGVLFTPTAAGTFPMYCTIGSGSPTAHKDHGMSGEVVVA